MHFVLAWKEKNKAVSKQNLSFPEVQMSRYLLTVRMRRGACTVHDHELIPAGRKSL
jgi:hypothetical protein